jgi:SH3-like domain-containing protein
LKRVAERVNAVSREQEIEMRGIWAGIGCGALLAAMAPVVSHAAEGRAVPYWASISAGDALMRSGPGRNFPAMWRYRRADLPVRVVQVHESWRKVRELDGTEGWISAPLLSAQRTAIVVGDIRPIRDAREPRAKVLWRAEPGVVGRISRCAEGWCRIDVQGRVGHIQMAHIWGAPPGERVD